MPRTRQQRLPLSDSSDDSSDTDDDICTGLRGNKKRQKLTHRNKPRATASAIPKTPIDSLVAQSDAPSTSNATEQVAGIKGTVVSHSSVGGNSCLNDQINNVAEQDEVVSKAVDDDTMYDSDEFYGIAPDPVKYWKNWSSFLHKKSNMPPYYVPVPGGTSISDLPDELLVKIFRLTSTYARLYCTSRLVFLS